MIDQSASPDFMTTLAGRDVVMPGGYVVGRSPQIVSLHREIMLLSRGSFPVLIHGETGVGKEHVANLLHLWSGRRDAPFVPINCAAIPSELLEAEMFGIGRGVASGVLERKGYFQLADGGTLFLDEIGELHLTLQAKLLRVLQDNVIRSLGGVTFNTDARVVAATNANLRLRVEEGSFRADLYYRLAAFELHVPPLREREGDLPLFIEHFIKVFSEEAGGGLDGLPPETVESLARYHWPGNVRELANEIRRLVYLREQGRPLTPANLSPRIVRYEGVGEEADPLAAPLSLQAATDKLERSLIAEALRRSGGNRSRAARLLGITRNGLALKMERLGIQP